MLPAGQVPFPCLIQKPQYPLKQCYLFRNTSCTSAAPQVTPLFSETHSHCVTMTPESPSFQFCCSGSREWCTHSCKEIYFQVSRKSCSSGFLFHLRPPSLGRKGEQGVCALVVAQQGPAACIPRSRIPAGAGCAALGGGNKAGSEVVSPC